VIPKFHIKGRTEQSKRGNSLVCGIVEERNIFELKAPTITNPKC